MCLIMLFSLCNIAQPQEVKIAKAASDTIVVPSPRKAILLSNSLVQATSSKDVKDDFSLDIDPMTSPFSSLEFTELSSNPQYNYTGYTLSSSGAGGITLNSFIASANIDKGYYVLPSQVAMVSLVKVGEVEPSKETGEQKPVLQRFDLSYTDPESGNPTTKHFEINSVYIYDLNVTTIGDTLYNEPTSQIVRISNQAFQGDNSFPRTGVDLVLPKRINNVPSFAGNTRIRQVLCDGDSITTIPQNTFSNCTNLEYVYLPNINTIEDSAFYKCTRLGLDRTIGGTGSTKLIEFPLLQTIGNRVWCDCTSLVSIMFGKTIQSIGSGAFYGCTSLISVNLTSGGTGSAGTNFISEIPDSCFYGCTNLASIGITDKLTKIGSSAFYGCNMSEFHFETTRMKTIESSAFENCSGLEYIVLPETITSLSSGAFKGCKSLRYVYSDANVLGSSQADNIVSTEYTTFINAGNDREAPIVCKKGTTTSLDGFHIYSGMSVVVSDSCMDVNVDTIKVLKNGIDVTSKMEITSGYNTKAVKTGGTLEYYITIPQDEFATYEITAADRLGNIGTTKFVYDSNEADSKLPVIQLDGKSAGKDIYQPGVKFTCSDNLGIAGVTVNGDKSSSTGMLKEDGTYEIEVTDLAGNKTKRTVIIDGVAPVVNGVTNNQVARDLNGSIEVTDDYLKEVLIDGIDYTSKADDISGLKSGVHKLEVCDYAGNKVEINFILDSVGPSCNITKNAYYNKNVVINLNSICGISKAIVTDKDSNAKNVSNGYIVSSDGKYSLEVTDKLSNSIQVSFVIDKTAPKISNIKNKGYYKANSTAIQSMHVYDENIDTNRSYTQYGGIQTAGTYLSCQKDGIYKIVAYDLANNKTEVTFTYDTKAPKVNVKKNKKYKKGTKLIFSDKYGIKSAKLNGKKVKNKSKLKKKGKNKLVVIDKAGNKTSVTFKVK